MTRILYGVQGTGNGHLSRARAIAPHLLAAGAEVDFVFSGRDRDQFFDMDLFGDWRCFSGMTFITANGRVRPWATAKRNNLWRLWREVRTVDTTTYDLVISDFEPVTAWAARLQGTKTVGIGHQYAFHHEIPSCGSSLLSRTVMRHFAPCDIKLGLHWHHFGHPILPPICDLDDHPTGKLENKIIVYLGFENPAQVIPFLQQFPDFQFYYYGQFESPSQQGNIHLCPISRDKFKRDLADCRGVISNAGFELTSEALHLGKRVLVKPLAGQMEQLSNALALEKLKLGTSMDQLDTAVTRQWLSENHAPTCHYPDVAREIVKWIMAGEMTEVDKLASHLWRQTTLDLPGEVIREVGQTAFSKASV